MDYSVLKHRIGRIVGLSLVLTAAWFVAFHRVLPLIPAVQLVDSGGKNTRLLMQNDVSAISLDEFLAIYQQANVVLIDARQPDEYAAGHIPGALNIPYDRADDYMAQLENMKDKQTAITYCDGADCMASIELAQQIVFLFPTVYAFFGGWEQWQEYTNGQ